MADSKLTGLSAITELTTGDLLYAVDDVAGTPTSKKITADNVFASLAKQAAYASRPAAGITGRIYFPTDSFYLERDDGAAWDPSGPIFPMTPPVNGDFAWINQGSATVSTTNGGVHLATVAAASFDLKIRKKTAPATPYTITAAFIHDAAMSDSVYGGLCWRQSSDGKLVTVGFRPDSSHAMKFTVDIFKMTSATAFSARYAQVGYCNPNPIWLRITDNGTNRLIYVSGDGQNYIQLHSVGRTDFLTADEIGFFVEAGNASFATGITLLSWAQS